MRGRATGTSSQPKHGFWERAVRWACAIALAAGYVPMTVHVSGSGLPTSTVMGVSVKLSDTGVNGGFQTAPGFTWNAGAGRWIQSREDASNDATIATDASGNLIAAWYYFKVGDENFTGFPAGNGHGANQAYLTLQVQVLVGGSSYNPTVKPIVTVLDAKTQGAWVHNGVATGAQANKRAEALKSDDASTSYSLTKTEADGIDENNDGIIDNEDYGPAGATGDFLFGVPAGATMNIKLNSAAWAAGQGVSAGPADTEVALGASDLTPPSAPSGLHATPAHNSVALDWTASSDGGSGISGYRIYRLVPGTYGDLTLQTAVPRLIGTVGSAVTTFTDATVLDGNSYSYLVRAVDAATNVSARSNQADTTLPLPDLTAPAAVTDLAAVSGGTTSLNLTWTAPTDPDNASGAAYDLRYSTSPIDDTSFAAATPVAGVPAPQTGGTPESFSVDGLVTGTPYYFALKTRDAAGNWSPISNQAAGTPQSAPAGSVQIDGGAVYTTSTAVTIDSSVGGAVDMRVREAGGTWSDWSAYSASIPFTLSTGDGLKTVEAEYRNGIGTVTPLSDTITLDTTAPTGTMSLNSGASYTTTIAVTVNSDVTGATQMRKRNTDGGGSWGSWTAYSASVAQSLQKSDGLKHVEVQYSDAAGNILDLTGTITLDTVAPTGTMSINNGAAYTTTSAVTINSDVTGATLMRKRNLDGGGNWGNWTAYSASVAHSLQKSDGLKTAEVQYSDDAGNILDLTGTITLDSVAPTGTMAINGGVSYTATTSVTIGSSVTGATEMRLREAGGTWSDWTAYADTAPLVFSSGDGLKTAEAEYRDAAGNVLALSGTITLDTSAPTGSMSIDAGAAYTTSSLVTIGSTVTGATEMRARDAAGTWSDWTAYAAELPLVLTAGDGLKTVEAEYRNTAGNVASFSDTITFDTTAPTASHRIAKTLFVDEPAVVSLSGSDALSYSGLAWTVDDGPVSTTDAAQTMVTVAALGSHTLTYWAVDGAGNESAHVPVAFSVKATAFPVLTTHSTTLAAYGAACPISGYLIAGDAGVADQRVVLQSSSDNVTFSDTPVWTTTSYSGAFTFSATPSTRTYYRARFVSAGDYVGSDSAAISVTPIAKVSNPVAPTTMYRRSSRTVHGYLWPRHTSGTSAVRIYRYRLVHGKWKAYGYVTAKVKNSSSYSKYSVAMRLPYAGKWRLRAYAPAAGGIGAAWSGGYDYVTVK
jgi:hypothetical protein